MPLVHYDIVRGRSSDQMVTEHSPDEMVIQDHGLGIDRSENIVVIHMINRR